METSLDFNLAVIGGGPAGTAAAITAARSGMRVLLVERGRFPRHKVCGEFVSAESLELLGWLLGHNAADLLRNSLLVRKGRLFVDGRILNVPINPPAASIARYDLDYALWNTAEVEGARLMAQTTVQKVEGSGPFRVQTSADEFRAAAVINASGRWSNFSRCELLRGSSRYLGFKAHMRGESAPSVDLYFFKGGYCGVQPVRGPDGESLVNICALLKSGDSLTWEQLLARHPVLHSLGAAWQPVFAPLSTFPIFFREPRPVSDHVLNVGDAAAFVDPFVGDGIALALRGGNLAARCLLPYLRGECTLEVASREYSRSYRRQLRPVYSSSSLLRRLVGLPRLLRAPILWLWEHRPAIASHFMQATRSKSSVAEESP